MAEPEHLVAHVIGIAGKHTFLDVGANDTVQVDDIFEDYEQIQLHDPTEPDKKFAQKDKGFAKAVTAELQVERVFPDYCACVLIYADRAPRFVAGDVVERGHPYRITASGRTTAHK